jgi:hypothetical protein
VAPGIRCGSFGKADPPPGLKRNVPRKEEQMALPAVTASQLRRRRPESRQFHAAVRMLRRTGNRVYRAGRDVSLFNGARVVNAAIEQLAQQRGEEISITSSF